MDKRPSITLKTSDFAFTNNELSFIKKYLHGKYPGAMSHMIDQTRLLMRAVQTAAKTNSKLVYYASRTHPEDTERYVVMEMLYDVLPDGNRALIGLEPIEDKDLKSRDQLRLIGGLRKVFTDIHEAFKPTELKLVSCGLIKYYQVLKMVLEYLDSIKQEIIVHDYSFTLEPEEGPHLFLDLRHKVGRSHHVRLRFDFFEQPVVQTEPVVEVILSDIAQGTPS